MNRTTNGFAKPGFASRPVRVALAMKIAFAILAVNVGFAAAKALLVKAPEPQAVRVVADGSPVKPFILPIDWSESTTVAQSVPMQDCHGVAVETVVAAHGRTSRVDCRKAL
ncbi:MAG: hypothetical protein FJX45_08160 [Alphaproteobacteria bacterium]|nr:hypothetical protein [Alphaproteobacteria bacterium]MBM3652717.1 hypothetical protein [Alphaproteobacteria bacterium]